MPQLGVGNLLALGLAPILFQKVLHVQPGSNFYDHVYVFNVARPGFEPRPTAYKASIPPRGSGCGQYNGD